MNRLYLGDNLSVLRDRFDDESVDLVYLDPPFSTSRSHHLLFKEANGRASDSPIRAFDDTWHWGEGAESALREMSAVTQPGAVDAVRWFVSSMGRNDFTAYLVMMTPRLAELYRVLKPTGSIFLHCDPTASHYLKLVMDQVFGSSSFRNEIVWQRMSGHGNVRTRFGSVHDVLLFYAKSARSTFNLVYTDYDDKYLAYFRHVEEDTGRRYRVQNILNPNPDRPNLTYEWNGHVRVWKYTKERMEQLHEEGRLHYSASGLPGLKQYLDESKGSVLQDVWTDIPAIQASETLGYPTQKPLALLERIISVASNPQDIVLDPFCGCGTTVIAAERLNRRWIGIDITHLAISLVKRRLRDSFGDRVSFEVIGEPASLADANALAAQDYVQFTLWVLGLVGAQPAANRKCVGRIPDGRIYFRDEARGRTSHIIVSVKSGRVSVSQVRNLQAVVEQEEAHMGALITLHEPSHRMRSQAASAGVYRSPGWGREYPRIQILTVAELLEGKGLEYPARASMTFKEAPKAQKQKPEPKKLPGM